MKELARALFFFLLIISMRVSASVRPRVEDLNVESLRLVLGSNALTSNGLLRIDTSNQRILYAYVYDWINRWSRDIHQACHRPGLYEFLQQHNVIAGPNLVEICDHFSVLDKHYDLVNLKVTDLFKLEYLVIGKGHSAASQFGHTMVRLSFCDKNNDTFTSYKSNCLFDSTSSYDFGFSAIAPSGRFSVAGGIEGTFPSFVEVVNDLEAARDDKYQELRDVSATPLVLTVPQKRLFFYLLIERFWTYQGQYKFLENNCASEILKILKVIFERNFEIQSRNQKELKPDELRLLLINAGIGYAQKIETEESNKQDLEEFVQTLNRSGYVRAKNVSEYINSNSFERLEWITENSAPWSLQSIMQIQFLEEQAVKMRAAKLQKAVLVFGPKKDRYDQCGYHAGDLSVELTAAQVALFKPTQKIAPGDFVPNDSEILSREKLKLKHHNLDIVLNKISKCALTIPAIYKIQRDLKVSRENLKLISTLKPH